MISLDKLVATFSGAYPQLDIRPNWNRQKTIENLAPFLGHFLGMNSCDHGSAYELNLGAHFVAGNKFVLEGGYFDFDVIIHILKTYGIGDLKERFILIGLAQNSKTADEFVRDFKKYDTPDDWTFGFGDDELHEYAINDLIPFSLQMSEHLIKHGFSLYDTSANRELVFDKIMEDIKSEI